MKTIQKEYTLYTFDELSQEAKDKARQKHNENNDYYFLEDCMNERLHELLQENFIKDMNDTSKAGTKPTQVQYSLSYCQGDGAMFTGDFILKDYINKNKDGGNYIAHIKHSGRYYHSNSKTIDIRDEEDNEAPKEIYDAFEVTYQKICKELERYGYNFIEYEDSEESFRENCEANEYTFLSDGTMMNE